MKTSLLVAAVAALTLTAANAQNTWTYDFGTATGTFTNANSASTNFLPAPPADGGTARVRVGNEGGGFFLDNPGNGSRLIGQASSRSGSTVAKFSIYDFAAPTTAFSVKFDLKFSGATNGSWLFLAGSGANFSNNSDFANLQTFAGLRWTFGTNGSLFSSNRSGSSWRSLEGVTNTQNTSYTMEVLGNNGVDSIVYRGGAFTLNPGTYDLWIDNQRVASGLGKAGLSNLVAIDSLMFYGESSTGNAATLEMDNIIYANHVVPEPSALALLSFATACAVWLGRRKPGQAGR
jgi:hypothetical protein